MSSLKYIILLFNLHQYDSDIAFNKNKILHKINDFYAVIKLMQLRRRRRVHDMRTRYNSK